MNPDRAVREQNGEGPGAPTVFSAEYPHHLMPLETGHG